MTSKGTPDLKKYMEKRVVLKLNANRRVGGTLRGYDQFMNLVLEDAEELQDDASSTTTTTSDSRIRIGMIMVRGSSILQMECLDAVD